VQRRHLAVEVLDQQGQVTTRSGSSATIRSMSSAVASPTTGKARAAGG
jgi:hypothetical protein